MQLSNLHKLNTLFILVFLLQSCASKKNVLYLQDVSQIDQTAIDYRHQAKIVSNDVLSIIVSAFDMTSVQPFNLPIVTVQNVGGGATSSAQRYQTYLVDDLGHIEMPIIGKIKVAGMTRTDLQDYLNKEISVYVKDPIVNVRIMNYKFTVIGEVNSPGTYTIEEEKISVLQALGMAGDLTIYGKRSDILVIREQDGKKLYEVLDLRSAEVFNSPFYYLKQNDVIVVNPNNTKVQTSAYSQNISVGLSAASIILSLITILTR